MTKTKKTDKKRERKSHTGKPKNICESVSWALRDQCKKNNLTQQAADKVSEFNGIEVSLRTWQRWEVSLDSIGRLKEISDALDFSMTELLEKAINQL